MRRNRTVPSHRPVGFADGHPALIDAKAQPPIIRAGAHLPRIGLTEWFLLATWGDSEDQVAAGIDPAAPATLVQMR